MASGGSSQSDLFGQMLGIIGGSCLLVALVTNSVVPLVIALLSLFCILCFMTGLGSGKSK
jgi:hypothetical protein